MENQDKQYTVYIRSAKEAIPVSREEFDAYYKDINTFRRTQMNHGRCVCPQSKWLTCDMDCENCPFYRMGDMRSLDYTDVDENGNEVAWADAIPDDSPLPEDIIAEASEISDLYARLTELMLEALKIGKLRLSGKKDREIAKEIGIAKSTFEGRIARAKKVLQSEFPELF